MEEKTDLHIYATMFILHVYVAPKLAIGRHSRNDSLIFNQNRIYNIIIYINID